MADEIKKKVRSIFISDTHLGSKGCQAEYLAEFLKHHQCEQLYLVGDIIDGWKMRSSSTYWPQSHTNVVRRVLTMAKRGTNVYYITGNHDEFLRKYSPLGMGNVHVVDEFIHTTADNRQLLVVHGDQFDIVTRCHKWLAFTGDIAYEWCLVLNRWLNTFRRRFGYGYWSLSAFLKHQVKEAVNFIGDYETALAQTCSKRKLDGVICGHIHHAEIRDIDGVTYFNCGDWVESCTALLEDEDGSIRLVKWIDERPQAASHPLLELDELKPGAEAA